ncbi:hypothetical protein ATPR_1323 [Acetobacter tropicalis NBRC 101654]|uniref:Uncharacterized protein n=1 Tax=Acetobacter tropicalis NBRC 101654 TaxID=749388 RepID=F7VD74_9PROT|nr:hypothetical protein ATPR_1323 [Acetobacter tropicalis NBRC 101654]
MAGEYKGVSLTLQAAKGARPVFGFRTAVVCLHQGGPIGKDSQNWEAFERFLP